MSTARSFRPSPNPSPCTQKRPCVGVVTAFAMLHQVHGSPLSPSLPPPPPPPPPHPPDMASLLQRTGISGSRSPFSGIFSIFTDPMVLPSRTSPVRIDSMEMPDDSYTLFDLCDCEEKDEVAAGEWIKSMVGNKSEIRVLVNKGIPEMLHWPFKGNYLLIPDVTVTKSDLAILTLEVVSENDYEKSVSKAVMNGIEMLRIWRTYNTQVDECTSFVVPNSKSDRPSSVMEVTVKFEPFSFRYSLDFVSRDQVHMKIKNKITGWHFTKTDVNSHPYLIRLSQEECNVLERGTTQVFSPSSIILKSNTAFWNSIGTLRESM